MQDEAYRFVLWLTVLVLLVCLALCLLYYRCDRNGKAPIHVAAHWKIKDMIRILASNTSVDKTDNVGRTPLYVCVSSLSTGLYKEDLKYQVPCIKILFHWQCDMLNLIDWLKWNGPGIPFELLANDEAFFEWYTGHLNSPHTLKNLCRKVIQQRLVENWKDGFLKHIQYLPLPSKLHLYLSRKLLLIPAPVLHNEIWQLVLLYKWLLGYHSFFQKYFPEYSLIISVNFLDLFLSPTFWIQLCCCLLSCGKQCTHMDVYKLQYCTRGCNFVTILPWIFAVNSSMKTLGCLIYGFNSQGWILVHNIKNHPYK